MTPELTILLVEDNPDHAELITYSLKANNPLHSIEWLPSGERLLQRLHRPLSENTDSDPPDLILLDLKMPKMSGIEILQQLQNMRSPTHPFPPVIMLSTSRRKEERDRCIALGAADFLTKTLDPTEMECQFSSISLSIHAAKERSTEPKS